MKKNVKLFTYKTGKNRPVGEKRIRAGGGRDRRERRRRAPARSRQSREVMPGGIRNRSVMIIRMIRLAADRSTLIAVFRLAKNSELQNAPAELFGLALVDCVFPYSHKDFRRC